MALLGFVLPTSAAVTLTWSANPDPTTVGYMVYQGSFPHTYTNAINCGLLRTNVFALAPGTNYFAVTAYNANGLESDFSAELVYVLPPPVVVTVRFDQSDAVTGPWTNLQMIITTRPGFWRVTVEK